MFCLDYIPITSRALPAVLIAKRRRAGQGIRRRQRAVATGRGAYAAEARRMERRGGAGPRPVIVVLRAFGPGAWRSADGGPEASLASGASKRGPQGWPIHPGASPALHIPWPEAEGTETGPKGGARHPKTRAAKRWLKGCLKRESQRRCRTQRFRSREAEGIAACSFPPPAKRREGRSPTPDLTRGEASGGGNSVSGSREDPPPPHPSPPLARARGGRGGERLCHGRLTPPGSPRARHLPSRSRIYPTSTTLSWPNSGTPEFGCGEG